MAADSPVASAGSQSTALRRGPAEAGPKRVAVGREASEASQAMRAAAPKARGAK
jgi:hypothetical protein